nr:hypothetical protein [Ruminococcus sp. AF46-10NS]
MYRIGILFQNRDFEHDVYELIKAFYPGNEITSLYEEDGADYDIRFRVLRDEGAMPSVTIMESINRQLMEL